jgi:hypothetical protein
MDPMAERNFPIQVVGVEYICDECGVGSMERYGEVAWLTNPVQYPHRCSNCGSTEALSECYPLVRHLRVEQDNAPLAEYHE